MATNEPIMAGVAGRYASALFDLSLEEQALLAVERDLASFSGLLDESSDLRRFVLSPVFSADDQERALGAVLDRAGIGPLVANVVRLMARNRRLFAAPDMIRAFQALAARHRGEVTAEVTSAVPLSDEQVAALKETLRASTGQNIQLQRKVDAGVLGGLIVKVGSRMIDSSLRTKLSSLKVALKGSA